jgi:fatty acid desaturase
VDIVNNQKSSVIAARELSYGRGYRTPGELRHVIADAHRTRLGFTTAVAFFDCSSIVALALCSGLATLAGIVPAIFAAALAAVAMARQLRALECLAHEGSHFNWSRRHRRLNDFLATMLAAFPTGTRISDYRESHLVHHGLFGSPADPDRQRFTELDIEGMDRSGFLPYARATLQRLPGYQIGWISTVNSAPAVAMLPLLWGAIFVAGPVFLLDGTAPAIAAATTWLCAYIIVLPVIRFVGESDEHCYEDARTVFDATVSSLGRIQRLVFHPHGDGYHTVHHMWPGVPHHRIARLHRALLASDRAYAIGLRYRTRVLSLPRQGLGAPLLAISSRSG